MNNKFAIFTISILLFTGFAVTQESNPDDIEHYDEEIDEEELETLLEQMEEDEIPEELEEDLENLNEEEIEQVEDELIEENLPFQEETINISEQTQEIPGVIKTIIPEQRITINLENFPEETPDQMPEEISIKLESSLEKLEISHDSIDSPTLEMWIDITIMEEIEEHEDELEALGEFKEEERIEFEARGFLNRIALFMVENIGFRFFI